MKWPKTRELLAKHGLGEATLNEIASVSGAAALLGVSRHALYRYMKRHGVAWQRD